MGKKFLGPALILGAGGIAGCATFGVGLGSGDRRPSAVESTSSELACRYAPVILNAYSELGFVKADGPNVLDRILEVAYDISETETHLYLQFQVLKPWSEGNFLGKPVFLHFLDGEDVFHVVQKISKGKAESVYFSSNGHGNRIYYPNADATFDEGERADSILQTQKFEGNVSGDTVSAYEGIRNRGSFAAVFNAKVFPDSTPYLGDRAFVFSKVLDHPLTHADASAIEDYRPIIEAGRSYDLAVADGCPETQELIDSLPIKPEKISRYRLRPVAEVIRGQTFSTEAKTRSPARIKSCTPRKIRLNHGELKLVDVPRFLDPTWYLGDQPDLFALIQNRFGEKTYRRLLGELTGSLPHTKEYTNDELLCPRLDPAAMFREHFPKTAELQKSSPIYLRHAFENWVPPKTPAPK